MAMLALIVAASTQQVDIMGPILKTFMPVLVLAAIIKVALLFMPKKRRHHQRQKAPNKSKAVRTQNLIPCPDCDGLISPKARVCPHCGSPIDANYVKEIEQKRNKMRRAERVASFLSRMIPMGLVGLIVIACAATFGSGMVMFIWIVVGLLLSVLSAIRIYVFFSKGKIGELLIMTRLRKGLPKSEYDILSNIYLPIGEGATTQIDHVVVSRFGVFVVETKNYSGWIFADAASKVWTQTIYNTKNTFQNPIRQNYRHVCAIVDNLGLPKEYIRGVVAFTGDCEFKTPMPEGVIYSRKLVDYIKSFNSPILKEREKTEIGLVLREWDASVTPQQRASHVDNLRQRHD